MRNTKDALEFLITLSEKDFHKFVKPSIRSGWMQFHCGFHVFYFQLKGGFIENFH